MVLFRTGVPRERPKSYITVHYITFKCQQQRESSSSPPALAVGWHHPGRHGRHPCSHIILVGGHCISSGNLRHPGQRAHERRRARLKTLLCLCREWKKQNGQDYGITVAAAASFSGWLDTTGSLPCDPQHTPLLIVENLDSFPPPQPRTAYPTIKDSRLILVAVVRGGLSRTYESRRRCGGDCKGVGLGWEGGLQGRQQ